MKNEWAVDKRRASLEFFGFVGFAFLFKLTLDPFIWKFSGPVSLIGTILVLTIYLRSRGETWGQLGFVRLSKIRSWLLLVPQAFLAMVGIIALGASVFLIGEHFQIDFIQQRPEGVDERWGDVRGNLPVFLLWLGIVWTSAAFGEEMFFRGFLIDRSLKMFADVRFGTILAILLPALVFGVGHMYYQGLRGLITTGLIGLWLGALFLGYRKNLWPLVVAHGLIDSLTFTAEYLDLDI